MTIFDVIVDTVEDVGDEFGSWANTTLGQNFLRSVGSIGAVLGGPLVGALGFVLPGLARGEPLATAFAAETAYKLRRGVDELIKYVGGETDAEREQLYRELGLTKEQIGAILTDIGLGIPERTAAGIDRYFDRTFRQPIKRFLEDESSVALVRAAAASAKAAGGGTDIELAVRGLTPEQLAARMGNDMREDAAATALNAAMGAPLYSADWFNPVTGEFVRDREQLQLLRAIARHRLADKDVLDLLDRRIGLPIGPLKMKRIPVGPQVPLASKSADELLIFLQDAERAGQAPKIVEALRRAYEDRRKLEATPVRIARGDGPERSFFSELLTATFLTAPFWIPTILLPAIRARRRG